MVTNYPTAHTVSGRDPPTTNGSGLHASGDQGFYPAKADNLSATHST